MDSPTPAQLRQRGGLKWTYYSDDVLAAWVAEMDYGIAPAISEALHAAVDRGDTAYFYPSAVEAASVAAADFWADEFGWVVDSSMVHPVPDVVEGLRRAIVHLTAPGSPVILHTPVYYPFFSMVERSGRQLIEVASPVDDSSRYTLDYDRIDQAFEDGAGCLVLCNPWNPTGRVFTESEIERVLAIVRSHGGRLIVDEIHSMLTYPGSEHVVAASLDPETVVTVSSASKGWNLPGLKAGQVVLTNPDDGEVWTDYFSLDEIGVGTFGLFANAAAYARGRGWLEEVRARLDENRRILDELIPELLPGARHRSPQGTYLAWIDLGAYRLDDPAAHVLDNARVAVTGGSVFRGDGSGWIRLNFATSEAILVEILERISASL